MQTSAEKGLHICLLLAFSVVALWSSIKPADPFIWWLEVTPAFIAFMMVGFSYRPFRLTNLLYILITLHAIILFIGGHYTYAEVPAFNWLRDELGFARNHFNRVGHFVQGFVPVMVGRELLLRTSPLREGGWLVAILLLSILGISAAYELLEWLVAAITGEGAEAFLATQGDVWDTQKDMALALLGAAAALYLLRDMHDTQLKKLNG